MAGTLTISTLSDGTNSTSATNCIQGSAKAWVNFNGASGAIRTSYNVSSVTRNSAGDYTINFTNAFSDANYTAALTVKNNWPAGYHAVAVVHRTTAPTTSACRVENVGATGGMGDPDIYCASFFR